MATSPIFATAMKKEIVLKNPLTNATAPKFLCKEKPFLGDDGRRRLLGLLDEVPNLQIGRAIAVLAATFDDSK